MFEFTNGQVLACASFILFPLLICALVNMVTKKKYEKHVDRFYMVCLCISVWFCWPIGGFFLSCILFAKAAVSIFYCDEFGIVGGEKWKYVTMKTFKF